VDEEDKIDGSDKVDESPRLMKMMKCPLRVILNLFQDLGRFVIPSRSEESLRQCRASLRVIARSGATCLPAGRRGNLSACGRKKIIKNTPI